MAIASRPLVAVGVRRHRERGVVGQQVQDRVDLAALEGVGEALHDLPQPTVAERAQRGLLAALWEPLGDRPAGAEERAVDRRDRGLERLGGLLRREPEHVTRDQRRPLPRGKVLERRNERQLECLAPLVARLGRGVAVLDPRVGIRLDPQRRLPLLGLVVDRQDPLRASGDRVEADVGGDPVQPRAQRAASAEPGQASPRAQERVLERVVGVVQRAEHAVAVRVQVSALLLDEVIEGGVHEGAHQPR